MRCPRQVRLPTASLRFFMVHGRGSEVDQGGDAVIREIFKGVARRCALG